MSNLTDADREALGRIIWETSRADESTISYAGANIVADAVLVSDWFQARVARAHDGCVGYDLYEASQARAVEAERELAELNGAICWDTTCLNCASLLDRSYEDYVRAEKAERERDEAREALARLEALADEWERTADECERLSHVRAGLSDERDLHTAAVVNRKRAENLRAALRGGDA